MADAADTTAPDPIADVARVRALLVAAAARREALSYSHMLALLGHRFTRPKMRALCRTLDRIDEAAHAAGEPALAVLVVREGDGLPGQGWWTGRPEAMHLDDWHGAAARALVRARQAAAFDWWQARPESAVPIPGTAPPPARSPAASVAPHRATRSALGRRGAPPT